MSNPTIEVPANIKLRAEDIISLGNLYSPETVELARFIKDLYTPKIEAEPFVVYRIEVDGKHRVGFKFPNTNAYNQWVVVGIATFNRNEAIPNFDSVTLARDEDVKVIERWTPEAEIKFGLGEEDVRVGADVVVRGTLDSGGIDGEGDVRVAFIQEGGTVKDTQYVISENVALAKGGA